MIWFKNKRNQIARSLPQNSALILESLPVYFRQTDVPYPYRQESNFYYLTGWTEPESLFILTKDISVLFIQKKDPLKEMWEGYRLTLKEAKDTYLMDKVHTIETWEKSPDFYLKGIKTVYSTGINPRFTKKIKALKGIKIKSSAEILTGFRQIKDSTEIKRLKNSIRITAKAHKEVALSLKPNISEQELHGIFIKTFMKHGASREGYTGIVASGTHATVMHYTKNNSVCRKGELLLLDAGAEKDYYTADVTRVYPVNGTFSKNQKKVYNLLLQLQKNLIKEVRPQVDWKALNKKMFEDVTRILMELNVLKGSFSENMKKKTYKTYLPHSLGHHLGIDVHDPSFSPNHPSLLKPGMVMTVEPGLYFPKECPVKSLRGNGFRIEDDILVTNKGRENLSRNIPKETDDIEALCS